MELPKRSRQHVIGDEGVRILRNALPQEWIYRDLEGKGDYGIDAEVEIFDDQSPTGLAFRVQVRSHASCVWTAASEYVQAVEASTRNYWRLQHSPVVVVVSDLAAGMSYWAFADAAETSSGVRLSRTSALPTSLEALRRGVEARLNVFGPQSLLLMAPVLDRYWLEVAERTGGDSFLPIDRDILAQLKLIYAQLPFLRYALCLPPASLVPWDVWVAKSHLAFNDYHELYWAVFDEVVEYLKPVVIETLDAAADRLRARDAATADVTAINWAEGRLHTNVSHGYLPSFEGDLQFWQGFDTQLKARGAYRFAAADAYVSRMTKHGRDDMASKRP